MDGVALFSRYTGYSLEVERKSWLLLAAAPLVEREQSWDLTSCVTIVRSLRVVVWEFDKELTQLQAIVAAENKRKHWVEGYARTVGTEAVVIYHMMGMADIVQEEYRHVDIEVEVEDRSCCTGSCSHCRQASLVGIAGDDMSASCPYLVACLALPADDVHSSCRRICFPPTRCSGRKEMRSERLGNKDLGRKCTECH